MKPWSSAKGWTPRRIDLAVWRFVLIPAITAAILLTAAFLATVAKADEWICTGTSICFDRAGIVYSNTTPGQMIVRASDVKTGEAAGSRLTAWRIWPSPTARYSRSNQDPHSTNFCDTIGGEE